MTRVQFPTKGRIMLFTTASRPALGPTQPVREHDHSPPSSAEVKNAWIYTATPQYAFTAWCSVNEKGKGTILTLILLYLRLPYISIVSNLTSNSNDHLIRHVS